MAGGNIEAIRDWANNYYPKSDDIADAFVKLSLGLDAYKLTIIGDSGSQTFTLVEDVQNDPQTYEVQTIDGEYTGLFFFHTGSTIQIYDNGTMCNEHVLSDHVDTIFLRPLVIATDVMTSNTTPNTIGTVSASSEFDSNWKAWRAFTQTVSDSNPWHTGGGSGYNNPWIKYTFNTPVCIKKAVVYCIPWGIQYLERTESGSPGGRQPRVFKLQASNDNTNWTDLWECTRQVVNKNTPASDRYVYPVRPDVSPILKNNTAYKYYRIVVTKAWDNEIAISCINLYKLQDPTP